MKIIGGKGEATASPRKPRFRLLAVGVAAALAIAALWALVLKPKPKDADGDKSAGAGNTQLISTVAATTREFVRTAPVSGEARPYRDVRVFAPAPGVRVAEVLAEPGETVEAGQPLARLDVDVIDAQMKEAEADVRQAEAEQARAADQWSRVSPSADDPAFSREEIAQWRSAAVAANAGLAAKKAALAQVTARLQGGYVRAPVGGLIIERTARVGEFADTQALFRIVGGNRLEIAAAVSEGDLLLVRHGQVATFKIGDGTIVKATLRVAPVAVDPLTRTGEALFDVPDGAPVRAGMYLRGEVVVEKTMALAVPQMAVSYASGKPGVFVVADGKAHLRTVTLGARSGNDVAVLSGLREGERVATTGDAFIMDGDPVRTTDAGAGDAVGG